MSYGLPSQTSAARPTLASNPGHARNLDVDQEDKYWNVHIPCPHFKMKTVSQSVHAAVCPQDWCTERQIDPIRISVGDFSRFLSHLFERVGLAAATIHTYKASILSALGPRQLFTTPQLATLN